MKIYLNKDEKLNPISFDELYEIIRNIRNYLFPDGTPTPTKLSNKIINKKLLTWYTHEYENGGVNQHLLKNRAIFSIDRINNLTLERFISMSLINTQYINFKKFKAGEKEINHSIIEINIGGIIKNTVPITTINTITPIIEYMSDVEIANKLLRLKQNADNRNIEFSLTFKRLKQVLSIRKCQLSGIEFDQKTNIRSIDRLDNNLGYTDSNIIVITERLNKRKGDLTLEELQAIINLAKRKKLI